MNSARENGCLSFRSAGSHSPVDVCIIDEKIRRIDFIQSKTNFDEMSDAEIQRIRATMPKNGDYAVYFSVQ